MKNQNILNSPHIWLDLTLPAGIKELFHESLDSLLEAEEIEESFDFRFLMATCSTFLKTGDTSTVESIGDYLSVLLLDLKFFPKVMKDLIPYITGIYSQALKKSNSVRATPLQIKFSCMFIIQSYMKIFQNTESKQTDFEEIDKLSKNIIYLFWDYVLGSKPKHDTYQENLNWIISVFSSLEKSGTIVEQHNYFLGHFLYEWIYKELVGDWGLRLNLENALVRFKEIDLKNAECLEKCSNFWKFMELSEGHLLFLEKTSFLYILQIGNLVRGRKLLEETIEVGNFYLFDQQISGVPNERIINLRSRLYQLSRFTGNKQEIENRLNLSCIHIRKQADTHYVQQEWHDASQAYSHLGYRYFSAAEFAMSKMLYQLSVYFFEKAEYCRSKSPDKPKKNEYSLDEKFYRRLEANGFIYGASGRLSEDEDACELFEEAADQLSEAAQHVFQNIGLHSFYNSTAHYFFAQSMLIKAINAYDFGHVRQLVIKSINALGWCFPMMKNVYNDYKEILNYCIELESDFVSEKILLDLAKTGYPDPHSLLNIVKETRQQLDDNNFLGFIDKFNTVRRSLIYINPLS